MSRREDLWVSWRATKGRTKYAATMLAIPFIGVSAILGSLVLTDYVKGTANQEFLRLGADVIVGVTDEEESSSRISPDRLAAMAEIEGVESIVGLAVLPEIPGVSPRLPGLPPTLRTPALAVSGDVFDTLGAELVGGRYLDGQDRSLPVVVVGSALAEALGVDAGGTVFLEDELFVVAGIYRMKSVLQDLDNAILTTPETASEFFGSQKGFTRFAVKVEPDRVDQLARLLPVAVNLGGSPDLAVVVQRGLLAGRQVAGASVLALGLGAGFLTLAFGALVIGISIRSSVIIRRREIGIRAALGHPPDSIARQFLLEAASMAAIGAGLGACLALVATGVVMRTTEVQSSVGPRLAVGAVLLAVLVSTLSSLAAVRATVQIDPATALRAE